ncbi:P-loop containing nucleoside triphosphate hydrolase protein [Gongronella butleri]|nr:P-loop containing nucleoside triphosphate hydrolase protein [Gongronella butleri]
MATARRFYTTFQSLGIRPAVCARLKAQFGIERPTLTQEQLLPAIAAGRDILLRDATGTGKSFGLALSLVNRQAPAMYITPNQELAIQVQRWVDQLALPSMEPMIRIGTAAQLLQQEQEQRKNAISSASSLSVPQCIVLDEADQAFRMPKRYAPLRDHRKRQKHPKPAHMLLDALMPATLTQKPQLIVASATLNRPLRHWLEREQQWLHDPLFIDADALPAASSSISSISSSSFPTKASVLPTVQHHCLLLDHDSIRNMTPIDQFDYTLLMQQQREQRRAHSGRNSDKTDGDDNDLSDEMLGSLAILLELEQPVMRDAIVFVHASKSNMDIQQRLELDTHQFIVRDIRDAFHAPTFASNDAISTNMSGNNENGKTGQRPTTLWIANEFAARGVDLPDVSHVFILGQPPSVASYLHMAGRTGRLAPDGTTRQGKVISLVHNRGKTEAKLVQMFKHMNVSVAPLPHVE